MNADITIEKDFVKLSKIKKNKIYKIEINL